MGPSTTTLNLRYSQSARCKAALTSTTTLLPSLADPSGAFDIPKAKCPPDRGSLDCVTDGPALFSSSPPSSFSTSPTSTYFDSSRTHSPIRSSKSSFRRSSTGPHTPPDSGYFPRGAKAGAYKLRSRPVAIPAKSSSTVQLCTPPLTPDTGLSPDSLSSSASFSSLEEATATNQIEHKDALNLLMSLFPHDGMKALPYSQGVTISATALGGCTFDGVILDLPEDDGKTLYVDGKSAGGVDLKESIVALLDLASETLACSALVIVLDKADPALSSVLHSLMYVGGAIVTKPMFRAAPGAVLVGMDV